MDTNDKTLFDKVRVGFRNEKLDWIEFSFAKDTNLSDLTGVLGKPHNKNNLLLANIKRERGGEWETMQYKLVELDEKLATTTNELYSITSLFISYLKESNSKGE